MTPLMRLARRISMALGIGRQTADTDESQATATLQVALTAGELRDGVPLMQHYGFASRPMAGADVVVVFQSGDRARGVAVATGDQRYRPTDLAPGEACLFHVSGSRVVMRADGSILLLPANGNVALTGTLTASKDVLAAGVSLLGHLHGGVQTGDGNTQPPSSGG